MSAPEDAERTTALRDEAPGTAGFRADVIAGLSTRPRALPAKYLYDRRGAELFNRITELDAYYPTRTECAILEAHGAEMARALGPRCRVVEFGSGSARKTEILLRFLDEPVAYVPVDISRAQLVATAERLAARFPGLLVLPVWADYNSPIELPRPSIPPRQTVVFFPGSTIGNLEPPDAVRFLRHIRSLVGHDGAALIGVDRRKDRALLERAYNDPEGVTAEFNLNLLTRINRELGADFDPDGFVHRAVYEETAGRIEMHLVSVTDQTVNVPAADGAPVTFAFAAGDIIVTEHSYKYTPDGFAARAADADLSVERVWSDADRLFSVFLLRA